MIRIILSGILVFFLYLAVFHAVHYTINTIVDQIDLRDGDGWYIRDTN